MWSPRYDFFVTGAQRDLAHSLADRIVTVEDPNDPVATPGRPGRGGHRRSGSRRRPDDRAFLCPRRGPPRRGVRRAQDPRPRPSWPRGTSPGAAASRRAGNPERRPRRRGERQRCALAVADALGLPSGDQAGDWGREAGDLARPLAAGRRTPFRRGRGPEGSPRPELDGRFLVKEVAVGPLYSVEVATDGRSRNKLGSTMPTGLSPQGQRELGDYLVQICAALGLNLGIFHAEAILTEDGFRLMGEPPARRSRSRRDPGGDGPEPLRDPPRSVRRRHGTAAAPSPPGVVPATPSLASLAATPCDPTCQRTGSRPSDPSLRAGTPASGRLATALHGE